MADTREAAAAFRERNQEGHLAVALRNAVAYLLALERWDEAWTAARECLELAVRVDDARGVAIAIGHLAQLGAETGDAVRAARLLGYGDAVYRNLGSVREPTEARGYDRALRIVCAALPEDRIGELLAEGAAMEQDAAVAGALAIAQPASQAAQSA